MKPVSIFFKSYQHSSENQVQNEDQYFKNKINSTGFLQQRPASKIIITKENSRDPGFFSEHTHSPAISQVPLGADTEVAEDSEIKVPVYRDDSWDLAHEGEERRANC